jgi:hypothetical protein
MIVAKMEARMDLERLYASPAGLQKIASALLVAGEFDSAVKAMKTSTSRLTTILLGHKRANKREIQDISKYLMDACSTAN